MNFGWAIEMTKRGSKVSRTGWNGKGMFVFFARGSRVEGCARIEILAPDGMPFVEADGSTTTRIAPCFVMKAADGSLVPGWLASQTDMLAEDWLVAV